MDKDVEKLYRNLVDAEKVMKDAKKALQECMNTKLYEYIKLHKDFYRRGGNSSFVKCDINNFAVEEFVEKHGHITAPYVMQVHPFKLPFYEHELFVRNEITGELEPISLNLILRELCYWL